MNNKIITISHEAFCLLFVYLLILPKLMLIDWSLDMWNNYSLKNILFILREDLLLCGFIYLAICKYQKAYKWLIFSCLVLFILLFLEARSREIWLKPFSYDMFIYTISNYKDLTSGVELFFNFESGWGMTFRKILFISTIVYFFLFIILYITKKSEDIFSMKKLYLTLFLILIPLTMCLIDGKERYRIGHNFIVHPLFTLLENDEISTEIEFDQVPEIKVLSDNRNILKNVDSFKNIIIIFYESVRWNSIVNDLNEFEIPHLTKLYKEGLLSKCFVPIPHSSKAYFSTLTGQYSYPAVEMRESLRDHSDSLIHELKVAKPNMRTIVHTSMHLSFENISGMFYSIGLDEQYEVKDLMKKFGGKNKRINSFGSSDKDLYDLSVKHLQEIDTPFLVTVLPLAAHYPYDYPSKVKGQSPNFVAYKNSIKYSDKLLGNYLNMLDKNGLLEETLLIIKGDHGESFGEHGTFVHNSSLYSEETTVPLIFWAKYKRLKHNDIILSRQIDVAPTILNLMGVKEMNSLMQGENILSSTKLPPMYMSTFFEDLKLGLLDYPYKYIYEINTKDLVTFNLINDPNELSPISISDIKKEKIIKKVKNFRDYQNMVFKR